MTERQKDRLLEAESLLMGMWVREDKQMSLYFWASPSTGEPGKVEVSPDPYQITKKEENYHLHFKHKNDLYLNIIDSERGQKTEYRVLLLNSEILSLLNITAQHEDSIHFQRYGV